MARSSSLLIRSRHRIEQGLYLSAMALFGALSEPLRLRIAPALGRLAYHLDRRHRRVALENLRLAFHQSDESELTALAIRCFESFGILLADVLGSASLNREQLAQRFEVEGRHHLEAAEARDRGVILLTGHLGNWEALAQYLALFGRPVSFVARPLDNPLIEQHFRRARERFGNRSIPKRSAARGALKVLRAKGWLGILMDQRVNPNEGKSYPFFGKPAYTTSMPARLSIRTGAPAVPIFGLPVDGWRRCRIVVHAPIFPDSTAKSSECAVDTLTTQYLQVIEETIREYPHLWLWMHRKWRQLCEASVEGRGHQQITTAPAIQNPPATGVLSRSSRRA